MVEGRLLLSANERPCHNVAVGELCGQLERQLPDSLVSIPLVDVDLELAPPDEPGFSRRPDLAVVTSEGFDRAHGGMLPASDVRLVVEIATPRSHRMDHVFKPIDYADAGIQHYWIIDLTEPVSLLAYCLADGARYQDACPVTGTFRTTEPFGAVVELTELLR